MSAALLLLLLACGEDSRDSDPARHRAPNTDTEPCEAPERLDVSSSAYPTGFVSYEDGSVNRIAVVPVVPSIYDSSIAACQESYIHWGFGCWVDADCGDAARDRCVGLQNEFGSWCSCTTLCSRDSDCDQGEICIWPPAKRSRYSWPECVRAGCTTGADCASGECGVASMDYQSERYTELGCRTPEDECRTNGECEYGNRCRPGQGGSAWYCDSWHPVD
jgi:hypothetical protein